MKRRALIGCGSRDWQDEDVIRRHLRKYVANFNEAPTIVIHGAARGADSLINKVSRQLGMYPVPIPYYGELAKRGGHFRNKVMLWLLLQFQDAKYEVAVEAFDLGGPGTENMRKQAEAAGVTVHTTRGSSWQYENSDHPALPGTHAATVAGSVRPEPCATPETDDTSKTLPVGKATSPFTQLGLLSDSTSEKKPSGR